MTTPARHLLRFAETVEEDFRFLREHGFACVRSEPTFVRFESGRCFVDVYVERLYEIDLYIGLLEGDTDEISYAMSDVMRLLEPEKSGEYWVYMASTPQGVKNGVRRLATLFRRYVDADILEEPDFFERLAASHEAAIREYWRKMELTQVREKLAAAWHAKAYAEVVKLLTPLHDWLTPAERGKLEYAEKKLR